MGSIFGAPRPAGRIAKLSRQLSGAPQPIVYAKLSPNESDYVLQFIGVPMPDIGFGRPSAKSVDIQKMRIVTRELFAERPELGFRQSEVT